MLFEILVIIGIVVIDIHLTALSRNQKVIIEQLKTINRRSDNYINNIIDDEEEDNKKD